MCHHDEMLETMMKQPAAPVQAAAFSSAAASLGPLDVKLSDPAAHLAFYRQHGYVLERGVPEAKQLFGEIAAAKPRSANFSTLIAGKTVQLDVLAAMAADAGGGFTLSMLTWQSRWKSLQRTRYVVRSIRLAPAALLHLLMFH